jgi:hypothetical protein
MKSYSRGPGLDDVPARPEEFIALQRSSDPSNAVDDLSSYSDDELDDYLDGDIATRIPTANVDGGREARKVLLAAWLVDFMTSGECVGSPANQEDYGLPNMVTAT